MEQSNAVFELQIITANGNDGSGLQVAADDVDGRICSSSAAEREALLSPQNTGSNGERLSSVGVERHESHLGNANAAGKTSTMGRIKKEMNAVAFLKVRRWQAIVLLVVVIIAVIIISLFICAELVADISQNRIADAFHGDQDDTFDPSLFKVPRNFNGSFQLPNLVFTEQLFNLSSSKSQPLIGDLEEKLDDLFGSSPALGRYFSKAEILAFRNGSVVTYFQLAFLMPEEEQDELTKFTLSREMVYNVFRQFLYDQDPDDSGLLYIEPVSLSIL